LSVIFFSGQCLSQWQPINGKQRFTTGLGVPSKDTGTISSADTSMITIRPQDSALWVKYKGDWYKVPRVTTSNPFNILNGGNSFGSTAIIGTTDNNDLKIINNNTNYWTFGKTGTLSNSGVSFDFAGDVTASSSAAITGGAIYPINYLSLPDTNRNVAYGLIGTHNGSLFAQIGSGQYFRQVLMAKDSSLYITPTYFNANKGSGTITGNSPTITSSKVPITYWNGTNHIGYTNGATVDTACGNVAANTFYSGFSSVAASGTQITLTVLSIPNYLITGSGGQVIKLPDATTLPSGTIFTFNNNQTSGTITVNNNSNSLVTTIPTGGYASLVLNSNSIAAGSWDWHFSAPSAVQWSTNTFNLGNASITNATWNASVIGSNKGGAGSVTGILKADGSGNVSAATSGAANDYLVGSSLSATRNVSTGSIFTYNSATGAYNLDTTKLGGGGITGNGTPSGQLMPFATWSTANSKLSSSTVTYGNYDSTNHNFNFGTTTPQSNYLLNVNGLSNFTGPDYGSLRINAATSPNLLFYYGGTNLIGRVGTGIITGASTTDLSILSQGGFYVGINGNSYPILSITSSGLITFAGTLNLGNYPIVRQGLQINNGGSTQSGLVGNEAAAYISGGSSSNVTVQSYNDVSIGSGGVTSYASNVRFAVKSSGRILMGVSLPTDDGANQLQVNGSIKLETAGNKINIATGTNASIGTATLLSGTVTVLTSAVTASSKIFVTHAGSSVSNAGTLYIGTISANTSFIINSTNSSDNDTINWWIVN